MLDKFDIGRALREIGLLLELKGENSFKVKAYQNGAETVENLADDLGPLVDEHRLTGLRSIGAALAAKIAELYLTGRCEMLERLREELPPGVIELSQVPGLSTKKIQALHSALNITSIAELQAACKAGLVSKIPGFGLKTEQKILEGIQTYENREDRILLLEAREIAERLLKYLQPSCKIEVAGSIRRWQETAGNANLVAVPQNVNTTNVLSLFSNFPAVTKVEQLDQNSGECRVRLASGFKADILVTEPDAWAAALIARTGSSAHYKRLQEIAGKENLELTEHGLYDRGKRLIIDSEAELYKRLGMTFVPPELREDVGEIELALNGDTFEDLIDESDIQGMVHCHTTYSDGNASVEEMALAAERLGMKYITITDHSPSAYYAGGLDLDKLKKQWAEIDRVQQKVKVKILRGTESDILEQGDLDYPDEILEKMDVVIASIHSRLKMDEDQMTRRLITCMKQKRFKVWGHALGRLVLRRDPLKCRMEEVLDAAAESRAAIEINGDPYRLDMEPRWARLAKERGLKFVISTDAHSVRDLLNLPYGIHMARRAGLRRSDVLNTLPVDQFTATVKP